MKDRIVRLVIAAVLMIAGMREWSLQSLETRGSDGDLGVARLMAENLKQMDG